jgi:predicted transcriptional regulator
MTTTIQVEDNVRDTLANLKIHTRETYNDVLERLIEDFQELNEETKKEIQKAIKDFESGNYKTHAEAKKVLGL